MAAYQYVFVMQHLTKVLPGGRELFKDITLSFLPGAKIGVFIVNIIVVFGRIYNIKR